MRQVDHADRVHFNAWCEGRRIRLDVRRAMWVTFVSDPDYYGDLGWSVLRDRVEASEGTWSGAVLAAGAL